MILVQISFYANAANSSDKLNDTASSDIQTSNKKRKIGVAEEYNSNSNIISPEKNVKAVKRYQQISTQGSGDSKSENSEEVDMSKN